MPVGKPSVDLPAYVRDVKEVLAGRGKQRYPDLPPQSYQGRLLDFRTPEHPVPVYTAAVGPTMAEAGAAVSDGVMVWLVPHSGIGELVAAAVPRRRADRPPAPPVEASVHAFVSDDLDAARESARSSLSYWVGLPAYNRALARAGYEEEAAASPSAFRAGDTAALRRGDQRPADRRVLPRRARPRAASTSSPGGTTTGVATVVLVPHPVLPGESYTAGVERSLRALSPS